MASSPFNNHTKPLLKIRGRSKAPMQLENIIQIIALKRSSSMKNKQHSMSESDAEGLKVLEGDFDLNLRLGSKPKILGAEENRTVERDLRASILKSGDILPEFKISSENFTAMVKKRVEEVIVVVEEEGERREFSEITSLQEKQNRDSENEKNQSRKAIQGEESDLENKEWKKENRLGFLLEAVRQISCDFKEEDLLVMKSNESEEEILAEKGIKIEKEKKRKECWMLDFYEDVEDSGPVVRSKRGRNQVLPFRYRDSVLEPWKRIPRRRSKPESKRE
ncbi:uncharacterized protein LOC143863855 [Tasmannia lanceolata]|uniref:uncharacterized protein LOC143863855 n=1 Tax=Tasmannia lanceolata TaxID=3420 RepID=UPI0040644DCA